MAGNEFRLEVYFLCQTASDPGLEQLADQLQENLRNDLDEQLANIDRKSDVNGSLLGAIIAPLLEKGSSGNATIARKRLLGGLRDKMPQFGAAVLCYIAVAESSNADAWEYYFDGFLDSQSRSKIVDELAVGAVWPSWLACPLTPMCFQEIHGCNLQLFYHVLVTLLQHLTDESLSSSVRTPRLVHLLVSLMDPRAVSGQAASSTADLE